MFVQEVAVNISGVLLVCFQAKLKKIKLATFEPEIIMVPSV